MPCCTTPEHPNGPCPWSNDQDGTETLRALPRQPRVPCPICHGVEGCDHTVPERARMALPGLTMTF